jgi:hypothetical protein
MVQSLAGLSPAGPRLLRGGKPPISAFSFDNEQEALNACKALQRYIDEYEGITKLSCKQKKLQDIQDRIDAMKVNQ